DLLTDVAEPLLVAVIAELLGIPAAGRRGRFMRAAGRPPLRSNRLVRACSRRGRLRTACS
ncbi:hypothetical protein, partial [Streptomyces eurythermus]